MCLMYVEDVCHRTLCSASSGLSQDGSVDRLSVTEMICECFSMEDYVQLIIDRKLTLVWTGPVSCQCFFTFIIELRFSLGGP